MNEEIILEKFAERFSLLIKNSSLDVFKIAEMLGIKSKSTIYRYMNGEMAPKVTTVKYAAEIFNVNPLWLMGYDVSREKEENITDTPEIRAIARDIARLKPEKKELFKNLLKQMSDEADEARKK